MEQQDVIVAGASSAGLFTAYLLAKEGVSVHVYEQAEKLAPTPRTLIVTPDLNRALGFVPEAAIVNTVHTFELHSSCATARITLYDADLVVERAKLTRLLAARAEHAGAKIHLGCRFTGLQRDGDRTVAVFAQRDRDRTQHVPARVIVGADGAHSRVARAIGHRPRPAVTVLQARVPLPPEADPGVSQVWFDREATPFFFWLIPESNASAAVGLVDASPRQARVKLDRFLRQRGLEPLEYQGARIPLYRLRPAPHGRFGHAEVLLVGDAAGQVKATTVGGTVTGLWGAAAAARAILRASPYRHELGALHRELHLHWLIRSLLQRFQDRDYDALLRLVNGRVAKLLQAHNRDQMAPAIWSVLGAQPRLLWVVARAFL